MKLNVSVLEKLLEIPACDPANASTSELRQMLDDLGLEVKGVEVNAANQVVFTIETLANRGDHVYTLGVAREISARTLAQIKLPSSAAELSQKKASVPVRKATDKCSKYALLELTLPQPMPCRSDVLAVLGEDGGKHHAIVDLLNYVQGELGQPMHAFDHSKIEGEIAIELSTQVEEIEALDGKTYKVPVGSILIKDKKKIVAVGGVIGCANSMVTESTTRVLIEAAIFDPVCVRVTARAMGISTDASYGFERGVDPEGIPHALKRLLYLASGAAGSVGVNDSAHVLGYTMIEGVAPEKRKVSVKLSRLRREFNLPRLDEVEVCARLKNLGYGVDAKPIEKEKNDKELNLTVPSWRIYDVENEDDIVEDVIRSSSLSRVKLELPALDYEAAPLSYLERFIETTRSVLNGRGFFEVMTKGFYSNSDVTLLENLDSGIRSAHVGILNAIEANHSHMKVTNMIHMVRLAAQNRRMGVGSCKVFELGRVFEKEPEENKRDPKLGYEHERDVVSLMACGRWTDLDWRKPESTESIARLFSGVVEDVCKAFGHSVSISQSDSKLFHPGIKGSVKIGRTICGVIGQVHPSITAAYDLKEPVWYAELDPAILLRQATQKDQNYLSDFPAIRRDLTLKLGQRDLASKIVRYIEESASPLLTETSIVDDFSKEGEGFRRLTLRLTFQHLERTLQHDEIDGEMNQILGALKEKHSVDLAN